MPVDGIGQVEGQRVVHEPAARPQAHNAGVRTWFRVEAPPFCTIPSPVPTSCSMKSLNGWMILLPSTFATRNAPPLISVPGAAVTIVGVWQTPQPTWLKRCFRRSRLR